MEEVAEKAESGDKKAEVSDKKLETENEDNNAADTVEKKSGLEDEMVDGKKESTTTIEGLQAA